MEELAHSVKIILEKEHETLEVRLNDLKNDFERFDVLSYLNYLWKSLRNF